ncbi:unnamed protein product [Darwinula stevensoni]|uniref:Uncharacterized protein n=1 Tax=Darwinula stevensoni TaxID=69355 RepID=A0A7R8XFN0_9CRUS|nr:unnamed protein product [Darwinula stevensoni]CAG0895695.1 unnamed protein product [Darwinula stevensoni]
MMTNLGKVLKCHHHLGESIPLSHLVSSSASHQLPPPPPHPFDATSKHLQQGSSGLHHSFSQLHISSEQHQSSSHFTSPVFHQQDSLVFKSPASYDDGESCQKDGWPLSIPSVTGLSQEELQQKVFRTLRTLGEHVSGLSQEVKKLRKNLGSPIELSPQLTDIQLPEDLPTFPLDSEDDLRQWKENLKRKELKTNLPWCSPAMNQPYPLTKEQVRLLLLYDFRIKKKAANSIADINTAFGPDTVQEHCL